MKVSIIIPVYKVEDYIERSIQSVIEQTYTDLEIILVDDCGGDSSLERAQRMLEGTSLEWRAIRHEQNRGQAAARNTGAAEASGDFIFFLDSDDCLRSDAIEHLVGLYEIHHADVIEGAAALIDSHGNSLPTRWNHYRKRDYLSVTPFESYVDGEGRYTPWGKLINRAFYVECNIKFEEGIIYEDVPWSILVSLNAQSVYFSGKVVYDYLIREGSTMSKVGKDPYTVYSDIKCLEYIDGYMRRFNVGENKKYRMWFQQNVFSRMQNIQNCENICRREKLHMYKALMSRYNILRGDYVNKTRILKIVKALSYLIPAHVAFYVSICARMCLLRIGKALHDISPYKAA